MENHQLPNSAVCMECGSSEIGQRPNGSFFCKNCGADVICATCPECGSGEIGKKYNGGYFCKNCGAEISSCPQCGSFDLKKGGDGRLFCRNCGAKLDEATAPDATESIAPAVPESIAPATVKLPTLPKVAHKKISKPKLPKKSINWKSLGIVAGIALVAVILTAIFVSGNCPLENEWVFGSNSYVFNKDGTFEANNTLSNSGTYTVEGDQLHLHYAFMGMLEKDTTLTYSIKGKVLTLSGDVALIGSGNETVPYECAGGGGNGLKIILIIAELLAAAAVIFFKILKPKQKNDPKPKKVKKPAPAPLAVPKTVVTSPKLPETPVAAPVEQTRPTVPERPVEPQIEQPVEKEIPSASYIEQYAVASEEKTTEKPTKPERIVQKVAESSEEKPASTKNGGTDQPKKSKKSSSKGKKAAAIIIPLIVICMALFYLIPNVILPYVNYQNPNVILPHVNNQKVVNTDACGDTATWTYYEDGTLVISGKGAMWEYYEDEYYSPGNVLIPWYIYSQQAKKIVVEEGITGICRFAFLDARMCKEIVLPESLQIIGSCAFEHCTSLVTIDIPDGVTEINAFSFLGCSAIKRFVIPKMVANLGHGCFEDCGELSEVVFEDPTGWKLRYNSKVTDIPSDVLSDSVDAAAFLANNMDYETVFFK